jgi:hypothetical protein
MIMTTPLQIQFGTGVLTAVRNDISNPTPVQLGILQDMDFDFSFTVKNLMGQYQLAVDVARGAQKLTGKFKFARVYSGLYDLFFGQGVTAAAGNQIYVNEAHTVPASSTYTVTATNHTSGITDLGVFYGTGGTSPGVQLTNVASLTAAGQYSVVPSTGVYTFDSADASQPMLLNYANAVTSLNELVLTNQLMGSGSTFSLYMHATYRGNYVNFILNQATTSKLSNPFKNQDHLIGEIDVEIFADSSNNIGNMSFTQ